MESAPFTLFIGFGLLWTMMGAVALIALLKADGQPIRFGKWGLLVAIPIIIPLLTALIFGAIYQH